MGLDWAEHRQTHIVTLRLVSAKVCDCYVIKLFSCISKVCVKDNRMHKTKKVKFLVLHDESKIENGYFPFFFLASLLLCHSSFVFCFACFHVLVVVLLYYVSY